MPGIEAEDGLAAGAVDMLPARAAGAHELPLEFGGGDHEHPITDADFLVTSHVR
jgi:hypothetical protein